MIFYVTDRNGLPAASASALLENIRAAVAAKIDFVQIREKDLPARELLEITREAVRLAQASGATQIIVNSRLDVALAARTAGVHLGSDSVPAQKAVEWARAGNTPQRFLIGVSCHSAAEARAAESAGASYVFFGPVFDTPSKRFLGSPQGIEPLRGVCAALKIPVIAIGGVTESNAQDCFRAGAAGIAAIRLVQETKDAMALASKVLRIRASCARNAP